MKNEEIKITEKYINRGYRFIARNEDGALYARINKPSKCQWIWSDSSGGLFERIPENLFSFVKWEDKQATSLIDLFTSNDIKETLSEEMENIIKAQNEKIERLEKEIEEIQQIISAMNGIYY